MYGYNQSTKIYRYIDYKSQNRFVKGKLSKTATVAVDEEKKYSTYIKLEGIYDRRNRRIYNNKIIPYVCG